jgi:predicted cupin superfamily sugar epimerase
MALLHGGASHGLQTQHKTKLLIILCFSKHTSCLTNNLFQVFEVHDDGQVKMTVVGSDLQEGQRPQYTVPPNVWFGAFLTHDIESFTEDGSVFVKTPGRNPDLHYSFVGVTCAPAYQFEDDEMATRDGMKTLGAKAEAFINYLVPS